MSIPLLAVPCERTANFLLQQYVCNQRFTVDQPIQQLAAILNLLEYAILTALDWVHRV